jgi:tetratricopeptide (TPR) repeat protein
LVPFLISLLLAPGTALAESPWSPEPAPVGWSATEATFRFVIREGEPVRVEGRYVFQTPDARGEVLRLVGPEVVLTSLTGPVAATGEGVEIALGPDQRRVEQGFTGLLTPDSWGTLTLDVLPAARTRVIVDAPDLEVDIAGAVDGWLPASDSLQVTWRPRVDESEVRQSLLMQGQAAHTFRGSEAGLRVESRLRWKVIRGAAARLSFEAAGLDELELSGDGVKSWRREGSRVIIEPKAEVTGLFTVQVAGRATLGKEERAVPTPEPIGVLRNDRYVTMYRSDLGELIPTQMPSSVPLESLPAWASNLSEGVPLAAWHGPQPLRVQEVSVTGVQGPDTVVTQARYILATAAEGRAGLRMVMRVRNERRQYLRLQPPPGWQPVVVRVGNQPVSWLSDGEGGILVPLEKSIETVRGLLSFPVDVEWVGRDLAAWDKKGEMTLVLPGIDAPVQQAEWEVHLPRGYRALKPPPVGGSRILMATDLRGEIIEEDADAQAARRSRIDTVSSALDNASAAYKTNDFETAQRWLDQARTVDDENEEVALLQDNLDVLTGTSTKNDMASRRVKDLAKAKTADKVTLQESVEKEAEYAYRSGDYEKAEKKLEEAIALATELQQTEQRESVAQTKRISSAQERLSSVRAQKAQSGEGELVLLGGNMVGEQSGAAGIGAYGTLGPVAPATSESTFGWDANGNGESGTIEGTTVEMEGQTFGMPAYTVMGGVDVPPNEPVYGASGAGNGADMEESLDGRGGGYAEAYEPAPMESAEEPAAISGDANAETVVLDKDYLERVPTGRSSQTVTMTTKGKERRKEAERDEEMDDRKAAQPAAEPEPTTASNSRLSAGKMGKKPSVPKLAASKSIGPPPPPPPPPSPKPAPARPVTIAAPAAAAPPRGPAAAPMSGGEELAGLGYVAEKQFEFDGLEVEAPAAEDQPAPVQAPAPGNRIRPVPERRAALEASPSPMALALPLDGPTLTTTQALLPAGELPEFRFRYRFTLKDQP